ncbi:MAG: hypothetical protein ACTMUB_02110 [cyanobacterium endosymbiont of Rhopalodia musculus]|nr:hypothetical protein [cyanobacterium endosymbiont of Epithemia clementina EcSB]WGT67026.1 hypothetical protein P3F56_07275 [cyanobacterium endosymbiont of Epithemia clementina EcSB]
MFPHYGLRSTQWLEDTAVITPLIANVVHAKGLGDEIFTSR